MPLCIHHATKSSVHFDIALFVFKYNLTNRGCAAIDALRKHDIFCANPNRFNSAIEVWPTLQRLMKESPCQENGEWRSAAGDSSARCAAARLEFQPTRNSAAGAPAFVKATFGKGDGPPYHRARTWILSVVCGLVVRRCRQALTAPAGINRAAPHPLSISGLPLRPIKALLILYGTGSLRCNALSHAAARWLKGVSPRLSFLGA